MKGRYNDIESFHPEALAFIMGYVWGELRYRKLKQSIHIHTTYKWQKREFWNSWDFDTRAKSQTLLHLQQFTCG